MTHNDCLNCRCDQPPTPVRVSFDVKALDGLPQQDRQRVIQQAESLLKDRAWRGMV